MDGVRYLQNLSLAARSLWAKKSRKGDLLYLPLFIHLADTAAVARKLWDHWISPGLRIVIAQGISEPARAEELLIFLMAAHDIGKATPLFQAKNACYPPNDLDEILFDEVVFSGLPMKPYQSFSMPAASPHALAAQHILERAGCHRNIAVIIGAHHGKPPDAETILHSSIDSYEENFYMEGEGYVAWSAVQKEYVQYALDLSGFHSIEDLPEPAMHIQVLLSGLVVMADWIASNEQYFPYYEAGREIKHDPEKRVDIAWRRIDLPCAWPPYEFAPGSDLFMQRFRISSPFPIQKLAMQKALEINSPGIFVVEAPMGMGKTEIAEVVSEIFAYKAQRSGIFFALPTQATSNAVFARLLDWTANLNLNGKYSVNLAHGKAQFNETYQRLFEGGSNIAQDEEEAYVHHWFEGNKKSLLADFIVGTIDQLLFAALSQKHVMLRHLGLANKVVIIDECHAYDAYMNQYLERALRWLGVYCVPVIILSATLPLRVRNRMIDAYLGKRNETERQLRLQAEENKDKNLIRTGSLAYPVLTYSDDGKIKQAKSSEEVLPKTVTIEPLMLEQLEERLASILSGGGCAGVVMNTVKRAQQTAAILRARFGKESITLVHSRYIMPDRISKDEKLLQMLSKPGPDTVRPQMHIVVGTQIIEQSLDIDFDVLITDLCPMDLLLQRIGRLHRHGRSRPDQLKECRCFVLGAEQDVFEGGAKAIYGKYLLMRTKGFLPKRMIFPIDIPYLVQAVYDEQIALHPEPSGYTEAFADYQSTINNKETKADAFRIKKPSVSHASNIIGLLHGNTENSERKGEAAVRDGGQSIDVQLVCKKPDGSLGFLPWIQGGRSVGTRILPDKETARCLARQTLQLPHVLCQPWMIDRTISELEDMNKELSVWQHSPWLKGELFLILDENLSACLSGLRLRYSHEDGLIYEKEGETDG